MLRLAGAGRGQDTSVVGASTSPHTVAQPVDDINCGDTKVVQRGALKETATACAPHNRRRVGCLRRSCRASAVARNQAAEGSWNAGGPRCKMIDTCSGVSCYLATHLVGMFMSQSNDVCNLPPSAGLVIGTPK